MIGILVITHGDFAAEILKTAELIIGKQKRVISLGLHYGDSIEEFCVKVKDTIESLDEGQGVLVFADLFGASPYNSAAFSANKVKNSKFKCITGVNLPMLLEALTTRDGSNLDDLTESCIKSGNEGIKELFNQIKID
ncbi:PTS sugar transporter subunit IIA [Clostridium tyrobutyricum]|jgi:PTS system mannose-specific IIA component|uniref:PTS sugar transporter subunit IIA n=1 Tax=Clostridium tyrobutyricum TaxID=1519 RepID=UPI001C388247|nr:PTS sugar transporter subunit IIA [Clostridium tyrobutyricum]MBV4426151.1 PTS sugar transporter subunit IIA [Clostridium tyrobutyricum]MBV4428499.1 PTS sugar transporter subunit IIA [Clostridium tyrobutyricum]MBV4431798.1 PTS sugar transporter subunit IIA [Clostridium tyrobutyricum]MBV4442643.1 PTS sugar transporter subunit IIA [Clostridium tyrobutyricum]